MSPATAKAKLARKQQAAKAPTAAASSKRSAPAVEEDDDDDDDDDAGDDAGDDDDDGDDNDDEKAAPADGDDDDEEESDDEAGEEDDGDVSASVTEIFAAAKPGAAADSHTVYVEGLPYEVDEDEVRAAFADCGDVVDLRLPRWHDSGRARGYAHLDFANAAAAQKALSQTGTKMCRTRYLTIATANAKAAPAAPRPRPEGCRTIFVRNLPYDATEAAVKLAFEACGAVADVRLAKWGHTANAKGFGYVQFVKEPAADAAVRLPITVDGRLVACDFDGGKPKNSFKAASGALWKKTKAAKTAPRATTGPPKGKKPRL
ncbi:hypothetical protein M885DRAFT_545966 [Pelagophyceae sp. CCMP2097]|nr:hypothetical protein M885DRAFT_545966 [Pelagophyceae sp. CCMP2097]